MPISAKIITDSKNEFGDRITTFVLTFPRIVLAEANTHRMLSRNSASSRAIPFKKMLKMVKEDPFIPIRWMRDHSGMQGNSYFGKRKSWLLKQVWLSARNFAVIFAYILSKIGLTKQICNRLLEPFMWHKVILTATEFENFFALRAHPAAEIHIADLAQKMLDAYNESTPTLLKAGQWHAPFSDTFDEDRLKNLSTCIQPKLKISVARCARISYNNFEGKDDYEADIALYDKLVSSGHMSPLEHCARAMTRDEYETHISGVITEGQCLYCSNAYIPTEYEGWCGNFRGFIQLRKTIEGENKTDNRVIKK